MRPTAVVLIALVALAGCGSSGDGTSTTVAPVTSGDEDATTAAPGSDATSPIVPSPPPSTATTTTGSPSTTGATGSIPAALPPGGTAVERATADAVRRTGADPADVEVVAEEEVTWRDASVGCPQKGMQYMQVLTDGTRIILQVGGRRLEYHAGGSRDLFYCAMPEAPVGE